MSETILQPANNGIIPRSTYGFAFLSLSQSHIYHTRQLANNAIVSRSDAAAPSTSLYHNNLSQGYIHIVLPMSPQATPHTTPHIPPPLYPQINPPSVLPPPPSKMCILHTLTFYDCQHTKTQTIPCSLFWTELISGEIRRKNASLCALKTAKSENLAGACPNCYIRDYPLLVNENFTNRTAAEAEALEGGGEDGGWTPESGA